MALKSSTNNHNHQSVAKMATSATQDDLSKAAARQAFQTASRSQSLSKAATGEQLPVNKRKDQQQQLIRRTLSSRPATISNMPPLLHGSSLSRNGGSLRGTSLRTQSLARRNTVANKSLTNDLQSAAANVAVARSAAESAAGNEYITPPFVRADQGGGSFLRSTVGPRPTDSVFRTGSLRKERGKRYVSASSTTPLVDNHIRDAYAEAEVANNPRLRHKYEKKKKNNSSKPESESRSTSGVHLTLMKSVKRIFTFDKSRSASYAIDKNEVRRLEDAMVQRSATKSANHRFEDGRSHEVDPRYQSSSFNPYIGIQQFENTPQHAECTSGAQSTVLHNRTNDSFGSAGNILDGSEEVFAPASSSSSMYSSIIRRFQTRRSNALTKNATGSNLAVAAATTADIYKDTRQSNRFRSTRQYDSASNASDQRYGTIKLSSRGTVKHPNIDSVFDAQHGYTPRTTSAASTATWKIESVRKKIYRLFSGSDTSTVNNSNYKRTGARPLAGVYAASGRSSREDDRDKISEIQSSGTVLSDAVDTLSVSTSVAAATSTPTKFGANIVNNETGKIRRIEDEGCSSSKNPFREATADMTGKARLLSTYRTHYGVASHEVAALDESLRSPRGWGESDISEYEKRGEEAEDEEYDSGTVVFTKAQLQQLESSRMWSGRSRDTSEAAESVAATAPSYRDTARW
ncbi:uncharacterized protein V2V93DRAFT_371636 [Kockiozyma suomiensis]|uniref:uncharacterized protein n=1 Tax=Kockiozyma suomiensis TaxID=1337062 RepID=UPI003343B0D6